MSKHRHFPLTPPKHNSMKITKNINIHNGKKKGINILDLFDDHIKSSFNLSDDEYNHLCDVMTDEEVEIMMNDKPTFSERRKMISIRNKYIK
jgi:hypothetical protein